MKKLKIKLLFSILIIILIIIGYKYKNNYNKSKYNLDTTNFKVKVIDYKISNNKLSIEAKGLEKLIVNYYFKTEDELKKTKNNLKIGDLLEINGKLSIPENNRNFYGFNYKKYLLSKNIKRILLATDIKIIKRNNNIFYKLKNNCIKRIEKFSKKEYLYLFILGKNNLESEIKDSYSKNGISHLFAISGMHITLITTILNKLLKKFNKKIRFIFIILFLFFFLFLTNFLPSLIRVSLMYIFILIKNKNNLKIDNKFIIIFIFLLTLLINPYYIHNLGFIFSFTISFSLIYFSNLINSYNNYFSKLFITSFIAFLTSIPILIYNFHQLNFITIISNLIFVPFVSLLVFPFSLFSFIIPYLEPVLEFLLNILENLSLLISKVSFLILTFKHPNIVFIIIYEILIIKTILYIKYKKRYLFLLIIFLIFHHNINYFDNSLIITAIDIGQGDCILLKFPNNKANILIDTGGKVEYKNDMQKKKNSLAKNSIIPYLRAQGISKLDYLITSHGDYDHMGEAINLVEGFKVEKVIFNCGEYNDLENELIKVLDKKKIKYYSCIKELNIDKNKLYFLQTKEYDNENDNSNVIYTELDGYKFMFMGDASMTTEKEILSKYNLSEIDFLKVGHHGSKTSSGKDFINEINPRYSVISVGKNNRYGHPNKEVLNNLGNSKIYRTDQDGSIMFKIKNNKLKIETCSP